MDFSSILLLLVKVTQLSNLSPTETPDNISYRSTEDADDLLYGAPKVTLTLLHSLVATLLCFPIGCLALNNVYKVRSSTKHAPVSIKRT